ncbi:hypothetical protein [Actinoplanes sp. NPDC049118]|uniref:hypothetical protein n=1 Tax=Actinoplanes sp. NPDC049118 TaxID=3155769 RepID=UPI0033EFF131
MSGALPRRRLVPTEVAALAAGVPAATVRKWASRGRIRRYGRPGRAEYDLDEVFTIASAKPPPAHTTHSSN